VTRESNGIAMNHVYKFGICALVLFGAFSSGNLASAQFTGRDSTYIQTKGFFYAPTPCELVEDDGDVCITVTVPLSTQFSFEPVSRKTRKRYTSFRGVSDRTGFFSIRVPPGRYRVAVRGVSYRVLGGGRKRVDVPLVPAQSVVKVTRVGTRVLQIPLVKG
jgi:hypothetical protein